MMSSELDTKDVSLSQLTTYQVGALQSAANRAVKKHKDTLLKQHGITGMQWHIIGIVYDAGKQGIRITDLAAKFDTTLAFMTNNVNLLESKGILQRVANKNDSRSRFVQVTPMFQTKCVEIEAELRTELRKSIYSKLTPDELLTYVRVLYKLSELS